MATYAALKGDIAMERKEIYKFSYDYLTNLSKKYEIDDIKIDEFINNTDIKKKDMSDVFDIALVVLQDYYNFPNVIKYDKNKEVIKKEICFPCFKKCATLDPKKIAEKITKQLGVKCSNSWIRYCKGIVSVASFLSAFGSFEKFKETCEYYDKDNISRIAFASYLEKKIDNMGFAIACNWLKELGYKNYSKPDTHTKDICYALKLVDSNKKDIDCFEKMSELAKECGVEAYKLDKVWWLICSGNFYRFGKRLPSPQDNKKDFIDKLSKQFVL